MKNVFNKEKIFSLFLISFILFGSLMHFMDDNYQTESISLEQSKNVFETDDLSKNLKENEEKQHEENISHPQVAADAQTWWDEDFEYRIKITITEPDIADRSKEPVSVYFSFNENQCHNYSLRIVRFAGSTQTEIPSQVWNTTYYANNNYTKSATITFSVSISQNSVNTYYLYYSSEPKENPEPNYILQTGLDVSFNSERLQVNNEELIVSLAVGTGFDRLKFVDDSYDINYHSESSLQPSDDIIAGTGSDTSAPDSDGFIRDWLIIGGFETGTDVVSWSQSATVYNPAYPGSNVFNYLDPSVNYYEGQTRQDPILGQRASNYDQPGADLLVWSKHQDSDNFIDFNALISPNEHVVAYAQTYVYFPEDQAPLYMLLGSDDGIRVYIDGDLRHENHVTRAPGTDQDSVNLGSLDAGWHTILVMVEENSGQWGFRYRFSTTSNWIDPATSRVDNIIVGEAPQITIESIELLQEGPIFATAKITWEKTGNMEAVDYLTFYQGLNKYKSERIFWWDEYVTTGNNTWAAMNTNFLETATSGADLFINEEGTIDLDLIPSTVNNLTRSQSYSAVMDSVYIFDDLGSRANPNTLQGIYLTDFYAENPSVSISSFNITTALIGDKPCIIPGYETDLDNDGNFDVTTKQDYNVTIEFWETMEKQLSPSTVETHLSDTYNALTNPLGYSVSESEKLFFNLDFILRDADNNLTSGIDITLYNTTDNWNTIYTEATGPNEFEPLTKTSNEFGEVSFEKLKGMELFVNVTFSPYNKPSYQLFSQNLTLDTTKSIEISSLNVTTLILNLKLRNEANPDPIAGANVSLYWNNTNPALDRYGGYIGSEISDTSGLVSFTCLNSSEAMGNYSIKVFSNGDFRFINATITNDFSKIINFTVASYTVKSVSVQIGDVITKLNYTVNNPVNPYGNLLDTHYWGQNNTISANYSIGINEIENAEIRYDIVDNVIFDTIKSGYLSYNASGDKLYYLIFNNSDPDFKLTTERDYTIYIFASKPGYQPRSLSFALRIKEIQTQLNTEAIVSNPYWGENITLEVSFQDLDNLKNIETASIEYSIESFNGNLTNEGNGIYSLSLNSSLLSIGSYELSINGYLEHYQSQSIDYPIEIRKIPIQVVELDDFTINWGETINFTLNVSDFRDDSPVKNANVVYELISNSSISGNFSSISAGQYGVFIDSKTLGKIGTYTFNLSITKAFHTSKNFLITVTVSQIETTFTISELNYIRTWKENLTLTTDFLDITNDIWIVDGQVTYAVNQITGFTGSLENLNNGTYSLELNTTQFISIGTYTIQILAQKNQYQNQILLITLRIDPISTLINNEAFTVIDAEINVTTGRYFDIFYSDIEGNGINGASQAFFEWTNEAGITVTKDLIDLGNGYYRLDFNTSIRPIGEYNLYLYISQTNYIPRSASITLEIVSIPIEITFADNVISNAVKTPKGTELIIQLSLYDPLYEKSLNDATVYLMFRGEQFNFVEISNGTYQTIIDTDSEMFRALAFEDGENGMIYIEKTNYTIPAQQIYIAATPKELANTGIPLMFIYIGGSVALLAGGIAGTIRYIRYANIPEIVKKIDKTKKAIKKGATISDERMTLSADEEIVKKLGDKWEILDLDLKDILGISEETPAGDAFAPGEEAGGI